MSSPIAPPSGARKRLVWHCATLVTAVTIGAACHDVTGLDPASMRPDLVPAITRIVVSPDNMQGWSFYDDQHDAPCLVTANCHMVAGPGIAPLGSGSAELAASATSDGIALILGGFNGTRLDSVTSLGYATYRQTDDAGNNLAIALQFNVDYDLTDQATGYQGRLVFEPYQGAGGTVSGATWQHWDAKAGKWWGSRASVTRNGMATANSCVQASPCSWGQLLAAFPNIGVHKTYGAVVLKAGSGWANFRGNVDSLSITVNGATTLYDFELTAPASVPALPPDSVPAWIYADTNLVDGSDAIGGRVAKNVVMMAFEPTTSLADRAATIASVNGTVVGGYRINDEVEGVYYVGVSAPTPALVIDAADVLATANGVALAVPIVNDSVAGDYRRPVDGPDAQTWQLDPSKADGNNWALESIAAPAAWGCSTGDASTRVAVLDVKFHDEPDLHPNVIGVTSYVDDTDKDRHGLAVSSIIAAAGNNQQGSTGVMWNASLMLYDRDLYSTIMRDGLLRDVIRMMEATAAGARVVNISGHLNFPFGGAVYDLIPSSPVGQKYLTKRALPLLRWALRYHNGRPDAPLFVVSAGNGGYNGLGREASFNGFPAIEAEFPSRVLVVAATQEGTAHNHLRSNSNFGPLVQIAAPGTNVMALKQYNATAGFDHTSAATPLVSGVAGLLISFDPTLTVNEVRDYIVAGALRGGQTSDGIPYLNAYEALKFASERVGGPLCGNRVWNDGVNNIVVQRGTARETIIRRDPNDYAAYLLPYHGGKRIDLGFSYAYNWDASTRQFLEVPYTDLPYSEYTGAWLSYANVSDHDNVMYSRRVDVADGSGQRSTVQLLSSATGALVKDLLGQHIAGTETQVLTRVCTIEWPVDTAGNASPFVDAGAYSGHRSCQQSDVIGEWDSAPQSRPDPFTKNETPILASVAPQGDAVFVPINVRHMKLAYSPLAVGCEGYYQQPTTGFPNGAVLPACATRTYIDSAVSVMVYRVDTATATWSPIALKPDGTTTLLGREINSLEVSEDGREIIISSTRRAEHSEWDGALSCHDEMTQWISVDRALHPTYPPGTEILRIDVPQGASCGGWVEAGGTVSSSRVGQAATLRTAPNITGGTQQPKRYVPLRAQRSLLPRTSN